MHINFKKDTVAISFNISSDDMEDMLDISMDESNDDIRDALIESFSNDFGDDVEMTSFKKGKNYVSLPLKWMPNHSVKTGRVLIISNIH